MCEFAKGFFGIGRELWRFGPRRSVGRSVPLSSSGVGDNGVASRKGAIRIRSQGRDEGGGKGERKKRGR